MIVEIALGIVLAVLILVFWPVIVGLAMLALGIAVILGVVGVAIYFAFEAPEAFFTVLAVGSVIGVVVWWDAKREQEREADRKIARAKELAEYESEMSAKQAARQDLPAEVEPWDRDDDKP